MQATGSIPRRITQIPGNKIRPRISADGSLVVYEVEFEICLAHTDTLDDSCLTNDSFNDEAPILSPDGQQVLFTSDRGYSTAIYSMNIDGSDITRLTDGYSESPNFSRDGTRIVYVGREEGGYFEIHTMDPDGSADVRLTFDTPTDNRLEAEPVFSPDGSKIAFKVRSHAGGNIWIMNADGSGEAQLTFGNVAHAFPVFGPEGTRIIYLDDGETDSGLYDPALYIMKIDGSEQTRLTLDITVGILFSGYTFDWR